MGLDMYLSAKKYLSKYSEENTKQRIAIKKMFPEIFDSGNLEYIQVEFEAGYWRKANQIHRWFVENVQDGTDNCERYYVSREQLMELKKLCLEIMADKKNKNKLPTQEGFFFGSVEYDEYYFADVEDTIKIIDKCLALPDEWEFEYHSSW